LAESKSAPTANVRRDSLRLRQYPKEGDATWSEHWIQPEESAHLAKAVLLALEANGFQIVKKPA
jgi:hypothetical protein